MGIYVIHISNGIHGNSPRGQVGVEGGGHGEDGEVLCRDPAVLPRHVRVERVARLRSLFYLEINFHGNKCIF